jgi:hypothetical protein
MQTLQKIFHNVYLQTLLALIATIVVMVLFGSLLFQPNTNSNVQMTGIIGIGGTLFLFFAFTLWKVNQQKQWISRWASHPILVLLTFATLPLLFTILGNLSIFESTITDELFITQGKFLIPHFLIFYFWEALIFAIAFLAHPERKNIVWHISYKGLIISILLSLGLWSVIMFLNEIQLQWAIIPFTYLESQPLFWPVIPLAILFIPIPVSYFFFYPKEKRTLLQNALLLIIFAVIPLRTICIFPALIIGFILLLNRKELSFSATVITYTLFNLFTLLLNWNWVI